MNTGLEEKRQALVDLLNATPLFFSHFTNVITGLELARIEVLQELAQVKREEFSFLWQTFSHVFTAPQKQKAARMLLLFDSLNTDMHAWAQELKTFLCEG